MIENLNTFTKTVKELNEQLGVSRVSYNIWRKIPGAPQPKNGKHDVTAWKAFIESAGLNAKARNNATTGDLQRDKLAKQVELLQIDIDTKRGDLLPRDEVKSEVTRMIAQFKSVLYTKLEAESPPVLEGMRAADIQLHLRGSLAEAFEQLTGDKWK